MREIDRIIISTDRPAKSLIWNGDVLVDWIEGGRKFFLDGRTHDGGICYGYRFDRAVALNGGEFVALYEVLGTKGLILKNGNKVREINRSCCHADVYEYPIALFRLPDGTPGLVHCPNEYDELEIEELESGKPLTKRGDEAIDFFHSRLKVSRDGKYLLDAGWVWQPFDVVQVFEITRALRTPLHLGEHVDVPWPEDPSASLSEMHSACFGFSEDFFYSGSTESTPRDPLLVQVGLKDLKVISATKLETIPGTIFSLSEQFILGLYDHPKLFDVRTGKVVASWPEFKTGKQDSSIIHHIEGIAPFAVDPERKRFAVADEAKITVIELG